MDVSFAPEIAMLRPSVSTLFASLSLAASSMSAIAAPVAPPADEISSDRLAQIYMGDTPMATTYGRGFATAPADVATLNYGYGRYTYAPGAPASDVAPPLFSMAERDLLVAAFVAEGIAPENIEANLNNYDIFITIELDEPDPAEIARLDEVARQLAPSNGSFFFNSSYSSCSVADFTILEDEARINAITESRSRIDAMAEALGVEVGGILSTIEVHGYAPVSSSCEPPAGGSGAPEVTIELGVVTTFELIR